MSQIRTVGDLVAALQQMPQDLPVLVGTHFDNDVALTNDVGVALGGVVHSEGEFHFWADPTDPTAFKAVTVA
jgi:hypothetical protein